MGRGGAGAEVGRCQECAWACGRTVLAVVVDGDLDADGGVHLAEQRLGVGLALVEGEGEGEGEGETTWPRSVVGMRHQGTPRRQHAHAKPTVSVSTPPPRRGVGCGLG